MQHGTAPVGVNSANKYKAKLMRHVEVLGHDGRYSFKTSDVIAVCKLQIIGHPAGTRQTIEFHPIPLTENYDSQMNNQLTTDEYHLAMAFASSFEGQLLKIRFTLRVIVKHGKIGEGMATEIPIKILPKETVVR